MVFDDIRRCDEHDDVDFSDETELLKFVRKSRWVSVNFGATRVFRINVRPRKNAHPASESTVSRCLGLCVASHSLRSILAFARRPVLHRGCAFIENES